LSIIWACLYVSRDLTPPCIPIATEAQRIYFAGAYFGYVSGALGIGEFVNFNVVYLDDVLADVRSYKYDHYRPPNDYVVGIGAFHDGWNSGFSAIWTKSMGDAKGKIPIRKKLKLAFVQTALRITMKTVYPVVDEVKLD